MELLKSLDEYIPEPQRDLDKTFLMPIEDVFSIEGRGTVVTGRIERGVVKVGEEVEIIGLRDTQKTVVTGVEMFRKELDQGQGILILTDLYGSTPSNIAARLLERYNVRIVSGISVPMLLRILNYPDADLDRLAEIAVEGAHNGVIVCPQKQAS